MEDIIDSGYNHTERVYKDFEMTYFSDNMICILKAIHYYQLMLLKTQKNLFKNLSTRTTCAQGLVSSFPYSNLNMEDIIDSDYNHAERVCKDFEIYILNILKIVKIS